MGKTVYQEQSCSQLWIPFISRLWPFDEIVFLTGKLIWRARKHFFPKNLTNCSHHGIIYLQQRCLAPDFFSESYFLTAPTSSLCHCGFVIKKTSIKCCGGWECKPTVPHDGDEFLSSREQAQPSIPESHNSPLSRVHWIYVPKTKNLLVLTTTKGYICCLLYTSPSPRD